jgi:hypothetical protein
MGEGGEARRHQAGLIQRTATRYSIVLVQRIPLCAKRPTSKANEPFAVRQLVVAK